MKLSFKLSLLMILLFSFKVLATNKDILDPAQNVNNIIASDNKVGLILETSTPTATKVTFIKLDFEAIDIGCGSEGDICAVGTDKQLYCYDFSMDEWNKIPLNEEITSIIRVDVDDDGKIYIIAECGIFYLDCDDSWVRLPGTGRDIGVGANFDVWKIGKDKHGENGGVWKLFCECNCNCTCKRVCLRYQKLNFFVCSSIVIKKCYWFRADIHGINIDVFPNGDAAVVSENGKVYIVDGKSFSVSNLFAENHVHAVDITVSNDGIIYITDKNEKIYRYDYDRKKWKLIREATVKGKRLCSSAFSHIWYIHKHIYTSAIPGYIPCIDP